MPTVHCYLYANIAIQGRRSRGSRHPIQHSTSKGLLVWTTSCTLALRISLFGCSVASNHGLSIARLGTLDQTWRHGDMETRRHGNHNGALRL